MQQRAQATRQKILDAAIEEFAAHGFHGARVDVIAEKAGSNKQRIYAYYTSKEGLYAEVLRHAFLLLADEEAVLTEQLGEAGADFGARIFRHYMTFHERVPFFWRLIAWENLEGKRHLARMAGTRDATFARLRELYGDGQVKGRFPRAVSFETFIFTLSALSFFYVANQQTMSQTLKLDLANPDVKERLTREVLAFLSLPDTNGRELE